MRSRGAQKVLDKFTLFVFSETNPRINPAKLKLLEKLGKLLNDEKSFRRMSKGIFESLLEMQISFTELEVKKEEKEKRKKEDYEMLKKLKMKQKTTFKQEQIINSKGFHKRVKRDKQQIREKKDHETLEIEKKISKRNKQKKDQKINKRLLETYYTVILKIIRLHYKKPVLAVGLKGLMRFINRMPAKFVGQILVNLRSIYMLMEQETEAGSEGVTLRKLKVIRTMLSLWKKINIEDQLENHFLQNKLYACFNEILEKPKETSSEFSMDLIEDLYVNFDNLVMKVKVSDSNVICNWFVMLTVLASKIKNPRIATISLFLMNKMVEKYEKLSYYMDESEGTDGDIRVARDLMMQEDKSLSLRNHLLNLKTSLKNNNRAKYMADCLLNKTLLGKKYIGLDLKSFLKKI
jgi:hypothetical protein